jgi:Tol biopolymer transport system component
MRFVDCGDGNSAEMLLRWVSGALVSLVLTAAAGAAPAARNGQLLYLRPLGGNAPPYNRLFVAAPDGGGARDITPAGILDVQGAAWSRDGRRIAISAIAVGDLDPEIFVVAADGSQLRRLTNNHLSDRQPTWSPDGRRIAFASARTGLFQIYSMRADGSRQRRLSQQAEDCETPAWSPNGRWIVFSCELGYWKLVRMRADGSGERRLLPGYPLTEASPTWTPDGRIVFARGARTARGRGVFSVRADGTGLRRLRANGGDPSVSPDGRFIAFAWIPDGADQELFVMRRNGTGARQITSTNGIDEFGPDWQRSG